MNHQNSGPRNYVHKDFHNQVVEGLRSRVAALETAQRPRPMVDAPRDTTEVGMIVRVAFRKLRADSDAHGFTDRHGRRFVHENELGMGLNQRRLHDEDIIGWVRLPPKDKPPC